MSIQLRPWDFADIPALAKMANNKKIWDMLRDRMPYPYSEKDALDFIRLSREQDPVCNFTIECNGELVGSIALVPKEDVYRLSAEIGYYIAEPHWGKGIATIAIAELLEYIDHQFSFQRIYAEVFESNKASMRVLEKNGFHLEGIRKKAVVKNNLVMDDYVFVKLKEEIKSS